jgi:hypothetical protein
MGTGVKHHADDLFHSPLDQSQIDFENEGGETYICGNPPYRGSKWQTTEQKQDLASAWGKHPQLAKITDFVSGWIARYLDYVHSVSDAISSFVMTNSICQGQQASEIWPVVFEQGIEIQFAHASFNWSNLASHNAGVTVIVVGLGKKSRKIKKLFADDHVRECTAIGPYLVPNRCEVVEKQDTPIGQQVKMLFGNMPRDGGHLFLGFDEVSVLKADPTAARFIKRFVGSEELIDGKLRYCLWIADDEVNAARAIPFITERLERVSESRKRSQAKSTRDFASRPHRFVQIGGVAKNNAIFVSGVSSENREYIPCDFLSRENIASNKCFALYDASLWNMALIASRIHWIWIATVCVLSYSNTLGWNTFPVPPLTEKNKADLTRCAEDILLAREAHFPATIAELYDPKQMPADLRASHDRNDETLERIYIGRRFRNDTERLEKLFELYTEMVGSNDGKAKGRTGKQSVEAGS